MAKDGWGLWEREAECTAIAGTIKNAVQGRGGMLLVEGRAGVDKTRLLSEAHDQAVEAGMRVGRARGVELERNFGFGTVHRLMDPLLAGTKPDEQQAWWAGAAAQARPLFESVDEHAPPLGDFAVLHGLYWLVANILSDILIEQGRLEEASAALNWIGLPDPLPEWGHFYPALETRAHLRRLQGRPADALACGRNWTGAAGLNPALIAWRSEAALCLHQLGNDTEAREHAAEELRLARQLRAPRAIGHAQRVFGGAIPTEYQGAPLPQLFRVRARGVQLVATVTVSRTAPGARHLPAGHHRVEGVRAAVPPGRGVLVRGPRRARQHPAARATVLAVDHVPVGLIARW